MEHFFHFFPKIKKMLVHMYPVFIFFFLTFYLIHFTDGLVHQSEGFSTVSFFAIFFAAAVMAKIVILADYLPVMKRLPSKPLIEKIIWKTSIYWLLALVMRMVEHFIPMILAGRDFYEEYEVFINRVDWGRFFGIQIWCLILIFIFVTYRELYNILGPARIKQIFFERD